MIAWVENDRRRRRYHVGNLRAGLLTHARAILQAAGLEALNLRSLAARAGIAPGSVYHHYANKTALLAEVAASGFRDLERQLAQAAREAPTGERIRTNVRVYFAFALAEPELYALMFDPRMMAEPEVAAAMERAFAVLEALLGEVSTRQARPRTAEELHKVALAVWACAHGAASMTFAQPEGSEALIEDVIQGLDALFTRP